VKLSTEDNPQEPNDYLALLSYLWKHNISVNNKAISNTYRESRPQFRGQIKLVK